MVELPSGWTTEDPSQKSVFLPEGWSLNAPPAPPERPSDQDLMPPKQWQKTRVPVPGKMNVEAKDIPGAPALLAATNLGGSEEDLPALQKHLSGIAEQEKNIPETEYSKARKEGKGFFEAAQEDFPGFLTGLKEGAKQSIIPMTGAAASSLIPVPGAAVAGGGISFAANAYANALINETRKYGGKLDDAKQFNETYLKNKEAIDSAATKEAAVSGAEGAAFGMIPGGGGLKGMLGRLTFAYPSIGVLGGGTRRLLNNEKPMTAEEMAQTGIESAIMGAPFEVAGLGRGQPAEGAPRQAPPRADFEGEVVPPAPQLPPPSGPAPAEPKGLPVPPAQEAPATVPPTPNGPVEARGPVTPPAPAAPPSEAAADLVRQGVPPLQAIQEVGQGAPVVQPAPQQLVAEQPKPVTAEQPAPAPAAEKPSVKDQINQIIGKEVSDRTNQLVQAGMPQAKAVAQAGNEVARKYADPQALAQLASVVERPQGPNIEPAPFNAPAAKPQPEPKAAEPEKPKQAGEVKFAEPEAAPKLNKVEGNKYVSMPASRFADAIIHAPSFFQSNQQDDPNRIPEGAPIQVRLDPSKLQNGGLLTEALASAKDAIQQVIVGPNAFLPETGPKEKKAKAVERNKRLQTALDDLAQNHGVSITYVHSKVNAPKAQPKTDNTIVGFIKNYGMINNKDFATSNGMPVGIYSSKGKPADDVFRAAAAAGYFPDWDANQGVGKNEIDSLLEAVKNKKRHPSEEQKVRAPEAGEEEAFRQAVIPAHVAEKQILNAFGRDAVLLDPDVLARSVDLMQRQNISPLDAYEHARLQKDRGLGLLTPEEADEWIKDLITQERPNEVRPQPAPAAGPAGGAPSVAGEKPAAPQAAQAVSERPQAAIKAKPVALNIPDPFDLAVKGQLTAEKAKEIGKSVKDNYREIENAILGDKADEWRNMHSKMHSAASFRNDKAMNAASDRIDEIESHLPEADRNALYGVGTNNGNNHELWEDLSRRLEDVEGDRNSAIRRVGKEIADLSNDPVEKMKWLDRERLGVIQHALTKEKERGGNVRQFLKDAFQDYADRLAYNGIEPNDVNFMTKSSMDTLSKILNLPKEEAGAEGKPQLVIPGAEKISEGEHAQRLAEKPMKAKVAQKEPEGLFGEERNQIDLLSMPEAPKPVAKVEEPKPIAKDFGPFKAGEKFAYSKGVHEGLANVAKEWAEMLGIKNPIYLTSFHEARESKMGGDWQAILNKLGKQKGAYGAAVTVGDTVDKNRFQAHIILLKETGNKEKDLETIAHELGHLLQADAFDAANPETQKKVKSAYRAWKKKAENMSIMDFIESKKAKASIEVWRQSLRNPNAPFKSGSKLKYFLSFDEYFADQVARWAMTSDKPLSVVEKFFKNIGSDLRKLYHGAKKEGALPNETFKDFIDTVTTNTQILPKGDELYTKPRFEREVFNPEDELKISWPEVELHRNGVLAQGLVDKFSDLYKVEKAYEKMRGAPLPENMSAYLAQELFNNRVIARQDAAWKDEVKPLLDEMKRLGVTPEDFGAFFYARHAEERNEVMRQRDPKRFGSDGGSGMTNQTARDILNKFRAPVVVNVNGVRTNLPTQYDLMDRLDRDFVRPIIRKDLSQRLQFGTITQDQYNQYTRPRSEGGYNNYVPLRGSAEAEAEADENIVRSSRKFGVSGKDFKIAFGRESEAFNPLFNLIQQRMEGIVRQEKNKVDNTLAKFVQEHPNNGMAKIITAANAPTVKYLAADGTVRERVAFTPEAMKTILPYKENGSGLTEEQIKEGKLIGQQKFLQFNKDNPAMARLVDTLNGMPANAVNPFMNAVFQFSRIFSRLNTSLVPDFFLTNFPRDVQDALMSMYATKKGLATDFMKDLGVSARTIFQIETGIPTSEADRAIYQEWVDAGGKLNYGGFRDIAKVAEEIESNMKTAFKNGMSIKDSALHVGDKAFETTLHYLSKVNDVFEDAVRFAVYRAARKNGYSKERAASLALNSTVNFQTKGAWMPVLNALKPFLSASVGSLRSVYRLAKNNPVRFGKFMAAMLFASIVNSLLGVWTSDKDKIDSNKSTYYTNVRDYERQKNFIIPYQFSDGHFAKLPFGFYYSPMTVMGDNIAGILTGNMTNSQAAINFAQSIYDYANPLGSGTWGSQLLFSPFAPFVQHAFNQDWLGRPIHPEVTERNKGIPASEQYGKGTPEWAISTAQYLNSISKGDQLTKGWLDMYPDTLNHYFKFFAGGLSQFAARSYNAVSNYFENTPTPVEEIPYLRRLMTNTKGIEESKYFDVKNAIKEKENTFRAAVDKYQTDKSPEAKAKINELGKELNLGLKDGKIVSKGSVPEMFRKVEDENRDLKEAIEMTRLNSKLSPLEQQSRVTKYENKIKANMEMTRRMMQKREPSELSPLQKMFNLQ